MAEAILEPELPIVDPHHHLWDRPAAFMERLPPPKHGFDHVIRMSPRYLFEELLADMQSGHNVIATVFMECGAMYRAGDQSPMRVTGETEFVNGVAARSASGLYGPSRACAGIVGHVDLTLGAKSAGVLEAQLRAGNGRFRGIRHSCSSDHDPDVLGPLSGRPAGLYMDKTFREGFAKLAPLGLSFDAWLVEPQLPELIDLARAFPDTEIILDHVGTPLGVGSYAGKRAERFGVWRDNIRALAKSPKVSVKLGGLAMPFCGFDSFMAQPPATSAQLAKEWGPYIETCIEAFGAERCMFESNFPVDLGSCSYATLWNAFKRIVAKASAAEKTALFSGTASRVYRLELA